MRLATWLPVVSCALCLLCLLPQLNCLKGCAWSDARVYRSCDAPKPQVHMLRLPPPGVRGTAPPGVCPWQHAPPQAARQYHHRHQRRHHAPAQRHERQRQRRAAGSAGRAVAAAWRKAALPCKPRRRRRAAPLLLLQPARLAGVHLQLTLLQLACATSGAGRSSPCVFHQGAAGGCAVQLGSQQQTQRAAAGAAGCRAGCCPTSALQHYHHLCASTPQQAPRFYCPPGLPLHPRDQHPLTFLWGGWRRPRRQGRAAAPLR